MWTLCMLLKTSKSRDVGTSTFHNYNFSPRSLHLWDVPVHVGLSALAAGTDVTGSVLTTYIPLLCPLQEVDQSG